MNRVAGCPHDRGDFATGKEIQCVISALSPVAGIAGLSSESGKFDLTSALGHPPLVSVRPAATEKGRIDSFGAPLGNDCCLRAKRPPAIGFWPSPNC
jgi:hypothetical protein